MPVLPNDDERFRSGLVDIIIPVSDRLNRQLIIYVSTERGRARVKFSSGVGLCDNPNCKKENHRYDSRSGVEVRSDPGFFQRLFKRNSTDFAYHFCYDCIKYHQPRARNEGVRHSSYASTTEKLPGDGKTPPAKPNQTP